MTRIEMLIDELKAGQVQAMAPTAVILAGLPTEMQLAEKIHSATGLNLRCCSEAAREIIAIYE